MCGIAGFVDRLTRRSQAELYREVAAMAHALRRRGPDGQCTWADEAAGVAFGHRRLAIIDLSDAAAQPMVSADARWVLTFNGEIYNYRELREELSAAGLRFRTGSDAEVLLEACAYWGPEPAARRLVGMFAFALWDRSLRRLVLVRDRLGIKPLYYADLGDRLLFGSEIKSLTAAADWQPSLDPDALASYFRFGYVPAPLTIYREASKLPPGSLLIAEQGRPPVLSRYWDLRTVAVEGLTAPVLGSDEEAVEELDGLLRAAVRHHMIADVPLGALLSGGIDSSTVVALMQTQSTRPIKTFSIGFHEKGFDEAQHAKRVADHLGCEHTELYVDPSHATAIIPSLGEMYDEPFADPSQIPTHLVSALARQHVTVALSGDGGDESFAGYNRYVWAERLWRRLSGVPMPLRRLGAAALHLVPPRRWDALLERMPGGSAFPQTGDKLRKLASVASSRRPDDIYKRLVSQWAEPAALALAGREVPSLIDDAALPAAIPGFTARMQFIDSVTYLPDDILTKLDRASMWIALEARVPLLDHRVVEFAWRQPQQRKLRGDGGKWLLRQVLKRYVPATLTDRPKMGFGVPIDRWLRGPLRDWAEDLLDRRRLDGQGWLNASLVRQTWAEHLSGTRDWHYPLWNVLMFQQWHRAWLG